MWELICHHTYKLDGLPVDLSDYDNHGQAIGTSFVPDGITESSGALHFQGTDRIEIPIQPVWKTLGGIKVEITARLNGYRPLPRLLVRGFESFLFCVWNMELIGSYHTTKSTWPGSNYDRIGSITDAIPFPTSPVYQIPFDPWMQSVPYALPLYSGYRVPFNRWVTFGFAHNGFDTMELYADGQLVARRTDLLSGVPAVGDKGVLIGASGFPSHVLDGDIDEVKIWRQYPHIMDADFFSRPVDQTVAECWERFFRSLASVLDSLPDCRELMERAFTDALDRLIRSIASQGPETRERFKRTCQEYRQLWLAGKLDSPEMERLFRDWCAWLRLVGISFENDPALHDLFQSDCFKQVLRESAPLDCDPQVAALVQMILRSCTTGPDIAV